MKREIRLTEDGSHTLYLPEMDEAYHSLHGAIQESLYVYIEQGLIKLDTPKLNILEIGFGTGLNLILSLAEATSRKLEVSYHAVEKYPLTRDEYIQLNYESILKEIPQGLFMTIHESKWDEVVRISESFTIFKEHNDIRSMNPIGPFDLVYYDAFAPQKQAHLWTEEIFMRIYKAMKPGALLLSYTSKGSVRRALISCGFSVERIPGPPGKRHMIRATKR